MKANLSPVSLLRMFSDGKGVKNVPPLFTLASAARLAKELIVSGRTSRSTELKMKIMKKAMFILLLATGTTLVSATFNEAAAQKKWSSRKKGAVVGAVVGAGTGAAVSHKKGKGALIGGAVGAGAGYLYGRHRDKKKGRLHS